MNKTYDIEVYNTISKKWHIRFINHKNIPSLEEARKLINLYDQNVRIVEVVSDVIEEYTFSRVAEQNAENHMTRDQLLKDYSEIIDQQRQEIAKLKQWEKCAEDLVGYAQDFVAHMSAWDKGYDRYGRQIKAAEDAIEVYMKLKNES
jgi:chromosome segregation ATPase